MTPITLELADAVATERAGRALATALHGGMLVELHGDLGAGKTTLARGVLRGMGHEGAVKSPTYAVVEHYEFSSLYLYHFDFYRFDDPSEWEETGFSEYFRPDSVCLVEWPERVAGLLTQVDLSLRLAQSGDGRELTATAAEKGSACLAALAATFNQRP